MPTSPDTAPAAHHIEVRTAEPTVSVAASPCVRLCALDAETKLCRGCGRSLEEIAGWRDFDAEQRRQVWARLPERLERLRNG